MSNTILKVLLFPVLMSQIQKNKTQYQLKYIVS